MAVESEIVTEKVNKHRKKKSRVAFEEEVVTKEKATEVLLKAHEEHANDNERVVPVNQDGVKKKRPNKQKGNTETTNESNDTSDSKRKKKRKLITQEFDAETSNNEIDETPKKKSKNIKDKKSNKVNQKNTKNIKANTEEAAPVQNIDKSNDLPSKTEKSKRSLKKMKHLKLQEDKKEKATLVTQQNVLNYLSKWKHSKNDWKFEKLKQIWLSQNLLDCSKIPNEFWDTTLEYFNNSKGFIRNLVLRDSLKIVDEEDTSEEKQMDEDYQIKLTRARDIIQNLQE